MLVLILENDPRNMNYRNGIQSHALNNILSKNLSVKKIVQIIKSSKKIKLSYVKNKIMNQLSYEVSTEKLEPHRISVYLYELASEFHSYWNMGKDDISKRFIEEDKTIKEEKLVFLKSIANTIKSGMNILGIDTPEKM